MSARLGTIVVALTIGLAGAAQAQVIVDMPAPPKKVTPPAAEPAGDDAHIERDSIDPGELALTRYAWARTRPGGLYSSGPGYGYGGYRPYYLGYSPDVYVFPPIGWWGWGWWWGGFGGHHHHHGDDGFGHHGFGFDGSFLKIKLDL